MATTSPNNISYPTNADAQKTLEQRIQDTATSVQTALNVKANLAGATFTGNVEVSTSGTLINGSNGTATFISNSSGKVPVVAKGASGQTAKLQEWVDNSFSTLASVDAAGRFLMPYQTAFHATRNNQGVTNSGSVIVYGSTTVNIGNVYNTSNGRFTAPVAGTYHLYISSIGNTSGTTRIYPRLNGAYIINAFHLRPINTGNYGDAQVSWMYPMAAGDYFDIYIGENSDYGANYSNFGGFLVG